MFNLGFGELVVILVVALLFLGPSKLPEIATGLGKIIRQVRKATADIKQDIELDDMIRKPLQELRDAATLPPDELKRRDEMKEAQRKAAEEEAKRREATAKAADEAIRKQREAEALAEQQKASESPVAAALFPPAARDAVSAQGTMIAMVPPPAEDVQTLTPIPDLQTPAPALNAPPPRLPPPPPVPRPNMKTAPADATVIDLHAQMNAAKAVAANETLAARSVPTHGRAQGATPSKSNSVKSPTAADATKSDAVKKD